jgi:hypothetical protein
MQYCIGAFVRPTTCMFYTSSWSVQRGRETQHTHTQRMISRRHAYVQPSIFGIEVVYSLLLHTCMMHMRASMSHTHQSSSLAAHQFFLFSFSYFLGVSSTTRLLALLDMTARGVSCKDSPRVVASAAGRVFLTVDMTVPRGFRGNRTGVSCTTTGCECECVELLLPPLVIAAYLAWALLSCLPPAVIFLRFRRLFGFFFTCTCLKSLAV